MLSEFHVCQSHDETAMEISAAGTEEQSVSRPVAAGVTPRTLVLSALLCTAAPGSTAGLRSPCRHRPLLVGTETNSRNRLELLPNGRALPCQEVLKTSIHRRLKLVKLCQFPSSRDIHNTNPNNLIAK